MTENPMAAQHEPTTPRTHEHAHSHDHAHGEAHAPGQAQADRGTAAHSDAPSAVATATAPSTVAPGGAPEPTTAADVEEAMRDVIDPELGINVVDLGLVYGITVDQHNESVIDMTLTSAACPLTDVIEDQANQALDGLVTGNRINWVWMPPWGPEKITPEGREQLRALGFNV